MYKTIISKADNNIAMNKVNILIHIITFDI